MIHEQALRSYYTTLFSLKNNLECNEPVQEVRNIDPATYTKPVAPLTEQQLAKYKAKKKVKKHD